MATQPQKRSRSPSSDTAPSSYRSPKRLLAPTISSLAAITPVRFLILSDTHGAELSSYPKCDVLLHCGDLTDDGSPSSLSSTLQHLGTIPAELKLIIAGNHEICLDKSFYLSQGGSESNHLEALASISSSSDSEANKSSVTFLSEGTHEFTLKSGATFKIYASPYTPTYGASAFQYATNEDRYNPPNITPKWAKNVGDETSIIPSDVDIVMTHGPPQYILDDTGDGRSAGCEHIRRAIARVRPRLHCYGHIHRGYGAQRIEFADSEEFQSKTNDEFDPIITLPKEWVGKNQAKRKGYASLPPNATEDFKSSKKGTQTLCVNAAIMDDENEPGNAPWIVHLELPVHG